MIKLKKGVDINNTCPEMFEAMIVVRDILAMWGLDCVITSGQDGTHGKGSLHPTGKALDFRTRDWPKKEAKEIERRIRADLTLFGRYYDIVMESDHLHIEWDKKQGG